MQPGKLILVTGGVRSGKSRLAENLARQYEQESKASQSVLYVATAGIRDQEMEIRVAQHRQRRPSHWETVEEELQVEAVIQEQGQGARVILLDCVTLLLSNWVFSYEAAENLQSAQLADNAGLADNTRLMEDILARINSLAKTMKAVPSPVILVTNEIGLGVVPMNPLTRLYRDLLGLSNQIFAEQADEVYVVWSGIPLKIKG